VGETIRPEAIEILANAVIRRGKYPTLVIHGLTFEYARDMLGTDIFKLEIHDGERYIYYWRHLGGENEKEIMFMGLKLGEYWVSIKPFNIYNFIKDFNEAIRKTLPILLSININQIVVKMGDTYISTQRWSYEKERGCGVALLAEYPSKTRTGQVVTLKFQMKLGKANLWIVEPRQGSRPAVYRVEKLESSLYSIDLYYRHGKKLKKTSLDIEKNVKKKLFKPIPDSLEILEREKTRIAGLEVERYTYRIRDENLRGLADAIMRESHKDRLEGRNDGFMTKRDVLGKSLAINFLYSIGIREVYVEPTRHDPYKDILRKILANRRPDVIGFTENEMYVTEIKYRFEERDGRRSLKNAIKQVSEYYDLLTQVVGKEILDRRVEKLSRIVVIIGYDHRSNGGYIILWRDRDG